MGKFLDALDQNRQKSSKFLSFLDDEEEEVVQQPIVQPPEREKATFGDIFKPAPVAPEQPAEQPSFGFGDILSKASTLPILPGGLSVGNLEAGISLGTGILAEPVAGLAGLASLPFLGGEKAGDVVETTREALTFQPRTEGGQQVLGGVGKGFEPIGQALEASEEFLGDTVFELTGSPALAAAAVAAPTAILEGLGLIGINRLRGFRRIKGIPDEVADDLARKGIDIDDLSPENVAEIQANVSRKLKENQERIEKFKEAGIDEPTRAQITRNASDFQRQQELAKTDTPLRQQLEAQEGLLGNKFEEAIISTEGQRFTSGSTVSDTVINRSTTLDNQISELYKQASELAPGTKNVKFDELASILRRRAKSDSATNGLINSVKGELEAQGILESGTFKVSGKIDVNTAEDIRKFINSHFDSTTPFGRGIMRELKEAVDNDVLKVAGEDIFKQARKAKTNFEKGLARAKVSKFDSRRTNLVRDILENKIDPDGLVKKVTQSKSYRAKDLEQLRDYLKQDGPGQKSWDDLRAQTMQDIKDRSFIGPEDAAGNQALSRSALERTLASIGKEKLGVLFEPAEVRFLNNMLDVAKLREPVRGTALGLGPSAQAVKALERSILQNPFLQDIFKGLTSEVTQGQRSRAALKLPKFKANVRTDKRFARSVGGLGGISLPSEE